MAAGTTASVPGSAGSIRGGRAKRSRLKYFLFAFIGLMFVYVLWNDESFLVNSKDPEWPHIEPFKWWLLPHGLAAACALFLGPLQFSDRLRQRFTKMHRVVGRFYVAGALIGAPLGLYVQYTEERLGTYPRSFTIATAIDAALWMLTTGVALFFILNGRVSQHREWMTRSFACALIFAEVRLIIGLTGWEKYTEAIVWACVACAIPLADLVLQWQQLPPRKARL